jgi:hypothetical protein
MDAMTLFVIVQLASGEVRTADYTRMPLNRSCTEAAQSARVHRTGYWMRAGAKRVMFYCAPTERPLVIAR